MTSFAKAREAAIAAIDIAGEADAPMAAGAEIYLDAVLSAFEKAGFMLVDGSAYRKVRNQALEEAAAHLDNAAEKEDAKLFGSATISAVLRLQAEATRALKHKDGQP